jgi:hypothetical protein
MVSKAWCIFVNGEKASEKRYGAKSASGAVRVWRNDGGTSEPGDQVEAREVEADEGLDIDDIQGQIADLRRTLKSLDEHLECGETCETREDALSNLDEAIGEAEALLKGLRELKKDAAGG